MTARGRIFWAALGCILIIGISRSWLTTRWDGFDSDEAWHAVAGAAYAQTGDYRLNPEHPPLVKLWVGAVLAAFDFQLPAFRSLADKDDERAFINEAVYRLNPPDVVQQQTRVAMLALHAALLVGLTLLLRRSFGPLVALVGLALLLLDPTLCAHLPLVLTDLPMALISLMVFLQAAVAFRSWSTRDLAGLSVLLGLALATKHSGSVAALAVLVVASVLVFSAPRGTWRPRLAATGLVFAGAMAILWGFYGFRFLEAPGLEPTVVVFNRAIEAKIADLSSGTQRAVLDLALGARLLPRAYLWGLADVLRVGLDGRQDTIYVLGRFFEGVTPWYLFPLVLLVKIPLGVTVLGLVGGGLTLRRRVPDEWRQPVAVVLAWGGLYLLFLLRGNSGYAGIRHALPIIAVVVLLAAIAVSAGITSSNRLLQGSVGLALVASVLSARPAMRPWEYYNELVGGSAGAWRYFADDGLDHGQRTREIAAYYDQHLRGTQERAYDYYGIAGEEVEARGLSFASLEGEDASGAVSPGEAVSPGGVSSTSVLSGTVFISTRDLTPRPSYDFAAFRDTRPVARFGNLLVFRGEFDIPWLSAERKWASVDVARSAHPVDPERISSLLEEVVAICPGDLRALFELGNLLLEQGLRERALAAYQRARGLATRGSRLLDILNQQIDALSQAGSGPVAPLRNPWLE